MNTFKVVEKFVSINGEGRRAGELAVFIRFMGCNLRCSYCDSLYAVSSEASYEVMTEAEIYDYILSTGILNVTLTGGEPLISPGMDDLIVLLAASGKINVEIETNGSIDISPVIERLSSISEEVAERVSFTVDYKCPGSGVEDKMCLTCFEKIRSVDTVKFVVSDKNDLEKMLRIISEYDLAEKGKVYVSPVFGKIDPKDIVSFMEEKKLNKVRLQLQLHKYIWDPDRRGV